MDKNLRWVKLADKKDEIFFDKNNIASINVEGQKICIVRTMKGLKACSSICPHASGDLSAGYLDQKENIVCPVHGYRFSLNHGRDTFNEGFFLKIFSVKESDDGIFVGLE